jgi:citrate lyase subunit beta/citryl-CoA lyase
MAELVCRLSGAHIAISEGIATLLAEHRPDLFMRRSRLYIPLVKAAFIAKSASVDADGFIFDLEDSVSREHKAEARQNVAAILPKREGIEYILRINAGDGGLWKDDLRCLDVFPFDSVMLPKVNSPEQVEGITRHFRRAGLRRIVLVETIQGVWNVRQIAGVLGVGDALGYGAGDLSTAFGVARQPIHASPVLQHAYMEVLMAAKANGVDVFDPPYRDYNDPVTLRLEAEFGRRCGSLGKQAIHPCQLDVIHSVFSPTDAEIAGLVAELHAFERATSAVAVGIDGVYQGKPTKTLAETKLVEYRRRGYVTVRRG